MKILLVLLENQLLILNTHLIKFVFNITHNIILA